MKAFLALLLLLCSLNVARAQDDPSNMIGGTHFTGYSINDIDTVSMINGNLMLHIPIYSLKQKGGMPLTFSVSGNNLAFSQYVSCLWANNESCGAHMYAYGFGANCTYGIGLHEDNSLRVCRNISKEDLYYGDGSSNGTILFPTYQIIHGEMDSSHLYQDYNSQLKFRSADGTGYLMNVTSDLFTDQTDYGPTGVVSDVDVYDKNGTRSLMRAFTSGAYAGRYETQRIDTNGNSIQRGYIGPDSGRMYYKDTVNRTFYDAPAEINSLMGTSSDVSNCPSAGAPYHTALYSYTWSVPGVSSPFIFCYARIKIRTAYYGAPGQQNYYGNDIYTDLNTTSDVLLSIKRPDGLYWKFEYDAADPNNTNSAGYGDLMKVITPQGGSISYTYGGYGNIFGAGGVPFHGLATRTVDDGAGNVRTWEYHVQDTITAPLNATATETTRVVNPLEPGQSVRNETVYTYVDPINRNGTEPTVEWKRETYQGSAASGTLLQRTENSYLATTDPSPVYNSGHPSTLPTTTTTTLMDTSSATPQNVTSSVNHSAYDSGFIVMQEECYRPATYLATYSCAPYWSSTNVVATGFAYLGLPKEVDYSNYSGYPNKQEFTTYQWEANGNYKTANILGAPYTATVTDGTNSTTTTYNYDENNGSPQGVFGNLTSTTKTGTLGGSVSVSTVYDASGRVSKSFDGRGKETDYEYNDAATGLVTKVKRPATNSVAHDDSYTYDPNSGQMVSHTDENGNPSYFTYNDPLGRLTKIAATVDTGVQSVKTIDYSVSRIVTVKQDKDQTNDGLLVSSVTYDGLGRPVSTRSPDSSMVDQSYGPSGSVATKSNPHFSSASASDGTTNMYYDALGRKTSQLDSSGQTEYWSYSANATTYKINTTQYWKHQSDAFGSLVDVYEDPSGTNLHTSYTYDYLGDLKTTNQSGRTRQFDYDSLGRLKQSRNLETGWVCYGTTSGAVPNGSNCTADYDGNGNLVHKTEGRGITVAYTYDALNRLVSKSYSSNALNTPSACYQYDSSSLVSSGGNLIGRVTNEWTQAGTCDSTPPSSGVLTRRSVLLYDALGKVRSENRCLKDRCVASAIPVSLHFSYDISGNLTSYDDGPGNHTLSNCYSSTGQLNNIKSGPCSGSATTSLYRVGSFWPGGAPAELDYGVYLHSSRLIDSQLRVSGFSVLQK